LRDALPARWQSGYAEDCKSLYVGSIPARASNAPQPDPLLARFRSGRWRREMTARFQRAKKGDKRFAQLRRLCYNPRRI
jgi:hypothetical protein